MLPSAQQTAGTLASAAEVGMLEYAGHISPLKVCDGDDFLGNKLRHAFPHAPADVYDHLQES